MNNQKNPKIRIVHSNVGEVPLSTQPEINSAINIPQISYTWKANQNYKGFDEVSFEIHYPKFMMDLSRLREYNADKKIEKEMQNSTPQKESYKSNPFPIIYEGISTSVVFYFVWHGPQLPPTVGIIENNNGYVLAFMDNMDLTDLSTDSSGNGILRFWSGSKTMAAEMKQIIQQIKKHHGKIHI